MTARSDVRTLRREDEALAPQLLTGTVQELPLLVNIGREATPVWIHSCYHRVEKQVAKVCCSMFFDGRFIAPIGLRTRKLVARKFVPSFSEEKTKKGAKKFAVTTAQALFQVKQEVGNLKNIINEARWTE